VGEWFAQLGQLVAPQTRLMRAIGLLNVMTAAAPATDWGWLHKAVARLRHNAAPGNRNAGRVRSSAELFALGLRLMAEVEAADTTAPAAVVAATGTWAPVPKTKLRRADLLRAVRYRDGLMIALLALRPLRLRNLVGLEIGRTLFAAAENEHRIVIGASDTKTQKPIDLEWPADLEPQLQRYLDHYRPRLLRHGTSSMLWIGQFGKPMATNHIVCAVIVGRTREGLGVPISPHLFRDCAATTIANEDPGHIGIASSLLGHVSIRTTDRHYRQANSINASRHYEAARAELRAQLRFGAICRSGSGQRSNVSSTCRPSNSRRLSPAVS
jgi:integrase/recombinase XerD